VIDEGETGYIVESIDEAVEAVPISEKLDRKNIRKIAEKRWTKERMVTDYINVYDKILNPK